ncbi:class I SAM-dependent methyltransferase [Bacillus tianshenii]|uniref:class I SAM-dependent DNA methyltransferase n=1 Tax=Sutcliffiella tianshenii TaxID=1463404 RepID=UPI001CD5ABCC|nr:class I SAM-dependent methyltransferase [Bacillus tianshenii]MCA1318865.1 class I SAM-dependent methyltransferase [Bacillus tianshenii]
MAYGQFAFIYDHLMEDVPYDKWVEYVKSIKGRHAKGKQDFSIVDVGCGTGEMTIRFAKEGWKVSGVDLSESMLAVAHEKSVQAGVTIPYFEQNMTVLDGFAGSDCVTIFCDSLNYLRTEEEIRETFNRVYTQLARGGLFMFDVHSLFKMSQIFVNSTFTNAEEEVSYIWNCFAGDEPNSVEHELSFFVLDEESGQYSRFDEVHYQRTHSVDLYKKWLEEAGFELLSLTGDFSMEHLADQAERVFFAARKI